MDTMVALLDLVGVLIMLAIYLGLGFATLALIAWGMEKIK